MISIDGLLFDQKKGEVMKPEADALPFRSSYSPGVGLQLTAERGPGFTLTLTSFDEAANVEGVRTSIRNRIGKVVTIIDYYQDAKISYIEPIHGQLKFVVSQARVIDSINLAAWQGYRFGQHYEFAPAIKVVSQWTMYAVSQA